MVRFILKRFLLAVPVFLGITVLVFVLANMAPGNPAEIVAASADSMTEEALEQLKESMGLDKPVIVRYVIWLLDLLHGDLGQSTRTTQPVLNLIGERIGPSLILTLSSLVVAVVISIPLGVLAAYKPGSVLDHASSFLAFFGSSTPSFFISLVLIYFFAVKWKALPSMGMYNSGEQPNMLSLVRHLLLPMSVLVFRMIGNLIKQTKGSILEILNEDYVKTARSKGLLEYKVIIRHALRNALVPVITSIGLLVPFLIGGAVITEQIFGWPGMGSLMVESIHARDYNAIMGVTVVISGTVLIVNIFLDVVYSILDPRISKK